jgi:hypothetical protein
VASFILRLLYLQENNPHFPWDRKLTEFHSQSHATRINTPFSGIAKPSCTHCSTSHFLLSYPGMIDNDDEDDDDNDDVENNNKCN